MQSGLFEIPRVSREDLPACHLLPEYLDGAHVRKLPPQTLVVLFGSGQPHSVVRRPIALVAEDEDYFVLNVDREAAKHGASLGRQWSHRVEHELMRDALPLFEGEGDVIHRKGGFIATGLRHGGKVPKFYLRTEE